MRLWTALRMTIVMVLLTGIAYPLVVAGLGELLFPRQAAGSLIRRGNTVVGSALIGQTFTAAGYFHGRPSAAGNGYDADNSGGSNLGPTNRALIEAVQTRIKALEAENPGLRPGQIPVDMVTTSGSGLDPEISLAGARIQIARVAKTRNLDPQKVGDLVDRYVRPRQLGVLGEPGVNVLKLNLALDRLQGIRTAQAR